jgi:uridine phosphorylase
MSIPRLHTKHASSAHFEPIDQLEYFRRIGMAPAVPAPTSVIFCYQRALLQHIRAGEAITPEPCILGRLYPLPSTNGRVAVVADFGIGAPAAAMIFDLLIAMGVQRFLTIGSAGSLTPALNVGDCTVCTGAIRDEGVSHHYLADPQAPALPAPALTAQFAARLQPEAQGLTWTIDAPFRETNAEIEHYRSQGVLTVEMEAAALFAVAQVRGVAIAGGFAVSDSLSDENWDPQFRAEATHTGLIRLYEAALATFIQS